MLYLVAVNLLGLVLTRSIEFRERELFTQRRRAEAAQEEVERRARAAEEAHQEKTRLLAAVSHDLRQPMVAAVFHLSALKGGLEKGDVTQAVRQANRLGESIDTLGATLDHLLTAARYDSGTEPIRIGLVELNPLLRRLEESFASDALAKGIELRIRVPERRLMVTSDAMTLWRVLLNLVSNSVKFTHAEGREGRGVLVRVRVRDGLCRIDVADTGEGIEVKFLDDIWQPYFQVANAERNRERGLGLGLFLVRRALDHLPNHLLTLRSAPGRGSRFSLTLPGQWVSHAEIIGEPGDAMATTDVDLLNGAYLMLIEDDRDARRAIEELFTEWGAVYSSGANVEEALKDDESANRLVDAIVSDYRLPGGRDGIQSILELRKHIGAQVPAVIITGESDLASIRRRAPAGVAVLQKPFSVSEFARPIVDAVRTARHQESL
ncbi:MAG: hybrid sensor histidine kinase/response regulator [Burkholderiaceae bacterium]|nr:hybrid sensor histidine kinase/response regulator [Burkholderiaceae bacterium]